MNASPHPDTDRAARLRTLSIAAPPAPPPEPARPARTRRLLALAGALAIGAAGLWVARAPLAGLVATSSAPPPRLVAEAPLNASAGAPSVPARGVVGSGHVLALRQATLSAETTAIVAAIDTEVGAPVREGDVLVRLDRVAADLNARSAEIKVATARSSLRLAQLDREAARSAMERAQVLSRRNVGTLVGLEDAERAFERQTENERLARQALAEAEVGAARAAHALEQMTIRAPFDGITTGRTAQVGQIAVAAADGGLRDGALVTLFDPRSLVISVDIAETSIGRVQPGMTGEAVLDAHPETPIPVTVTAIAPAASAERGTVAVRLAMTDPPPTVRPNMAVRVTLTALEPNDARH